jgi:membrane protein
VTTDFHRDAAIGRHDRPGSRWRNSFRRVIRSFSGDHDLWSVSAGVAFYAWYAAIFGVVFLVSLYSLGSEPQTVRAKIEGLNGALPAGAVRFLADQMQSVASAPKLRLSSSLAFAFLIALWTARSAVAALIAALNITFQERERRSALRLQIVTVSLTIGAALFVTAALALALFLPEAVDRWAIDPAVKAAISIARWTGDLNVACVGDTLPVRAQPPKTAVAMGERRCGGGDSALGARLRRLLVHRYEFLPW